MRSWGEAQNPGARGDNQAGDGLSRPRKRHEPPPSASTLVLIRLVVQTAVIVLHRSAGSVVRAQFDALHRLPSVDAFFPAVVAGANRYRPVSDSALCLPLVVNGIAPAYLIDLYPCPEWFDTLALTAPWRSYRMEAFDWSLIALLQALLGAMGVITARLSRVLLRHAS